MSKDKNTAVEVYSEGSFALSNEAVGNVAEIIHGNVGGGDLGRFDLPAVKVPSGGALQWEVMDVDGEVDYIKQVEGIILSMQVNRSYWASGMEESGGGTPPECFSVDGNTGFGVLGPDDPEPAKHDCATCKHNQFGTAKKGGGKACKETRVMFILQPGSLLPIVVSAPPGSLQNMKSYGLGLANKALHLGHVVTALSLEKKTNKGNIEFAAIKPKMLRKLTEEEIAGVKQYSEVFKPKPAVSVNPDDYQDAAEI